MRESRELSKRLAYGNISSLEGWKLKNKKNFTDNGIIKLVKLLEKLLEQIWAADISV